MGRLHMNIMKPVEEGILKAPHDHHDLKSSANNLEMIDNLHYHCRNYSNDNDNEHKNDGGYLCSDVEDWDGNSPDDDPNIVMFWKSHESLLQEILEHHNSSNLKLRQEVERIIGLAKHTNFCSCLKPDTKNSQQGCINCLRHKVVDMLSEKRFSATICTSKWKNTRDIPGGKHEYIELIASTSTKKKKIAYLVELEFKDQFEIAKPCEQYRSMVSQLPEYYIGKADCLNAIVRILCEASKRSMKEKKIHMGPWRKRSFMQMKWSNSSPKVDDSLAFQHNEIL
ncbi:hypothetical protein LINPERHAP2_LOCUS16055 [Linum perenne]